MKWLAYAVASILGLLAIAVLGLLSWGARSDAGMIRASIDLNRPAADVWPWLREPAKLTKWVSWLVEVRDPAPSKTAIGSRQIWIMEDPNAGNQRIHVEGTVTRHDPPRHLILTTATPGAFTGSQEYTLTAAAPSRTRLEVVGRYRFEHWLARLMEPIITRQAQSKLLTDLTRLQQSLESNPR